MQKRMQVKIPAPIANTVTENITHMKQSNHSFVTKNGNTSYLESS